MDRSTEMLMERVRNDYPFYAANLLKIVTKAGGKPQPFKMNRAQWVLHRMVERQRQQTGKVRVLVLKGRQMGISTYILGRVYRAVSTRGGYQGFILTHEQPATTNLFRRLKRMHDLMNLKFKPEDTSNNANELMFGASGSGVKVATAQSTSGGVGRSDTFQFFHGSEVGFWPQSADHFSGAMQTLAGTDGSECWLESTANGPTGTFYDEWIKAEQGQSVFLPAFLPWYWHTEYQKEPPEGWAPPRVIAEYMVLYSLSPAQGRWMQEKNWELKGTDDEIGWRFRQEYPGSAAEAFQSSGMENALIRPEVILLARKAKRFEPWEGASWVLGVDIARGGKDSTRILDRKGRVMGYQINEVVKNGHDLMPIANRVGYLLNQYPEIRRAYIDVTGVGAGVYDVLRAQGFEHRVAGINFGAKPDEEEKYVNKRAEMWGRMAEWFMSPGGVNVPDDDIFQRHLTAPKHSFRMNNQMQLELKEKIIERVGFSPDYGDAGALTFAENLPWEPIMRPREVTEFEKGMDQDFDDYGPGSFDERFAYMGR